MDQEKFDFISVDFIPLLNALQADAAGKWGKMNGQQMVEHVAGFFKYLQVKLNFC